jgi:hypothetical protein
MSRNSESGASSWHVMILERVIHAVDTFSYQLIHNGFSDTAFAYCDRCGRTALLKACECFTAAELPHDLNRRSGASVLSGFALPR